MFYFAGEDRRVRRRRVHQKRTGTARAELKVEKLNCKPCRTVCKETQDEADVQVERGCKETEFNVRTEVDDLGKDTTPKSSQWIVFDIVTPKSRDTETLQRAVSDPTSAKSPEAKKKGNALVYCRSR